MSTSAITSYLTSYASSTSNSTSSTTDSDNSTLSLDDFITLLVAQMENQDMYNTMDSTETIAQMAQMSMVSALDELSAQSALSSSFSLIGKGATVTTDDETVYGVVDGVTITDGVAQVVIDGTEYSVDDITEVFDADLLDS